MNILPFSESNLSSQLFIELAPSNGDLAPHNKVTIVGVGQVGMACAYSIFQQNLASELALVDVCEDKLQGEMMDLQHCRTYLRHCRVKASTDYAITSDSKVCIVTAGCRQRKGESRLSLVQRNVEIFKGIIPKLVRYSPNTLLLIVTNPVDVLTFVAWKLSGLPKERVFGSGTSLDSARFRFLILERLDLKIAPSDCNAWIIGEHGDSSVAVWSGVNIAGNMVVSSAEGSHEQDSWEKEVHSAVVQSAYEIIRLKGYTSLAIGLMVCDIVAAIMHDSRQIFALSTSTKGIYGIEDDVFLSLPCVVANSGLKYLIRQNLRPDEVEKIHKSAMALNAVQESLVGLEKEVYIDRH